MKKPILIVTLMVVLAACGGADSEPVAEQATPEPLPTYTLLPTYTFFPTFTQPPEPTATATFLPSPTPVEEEATAEGDEAVADTPTATVQTASSTGVTLGFGSNLRSGPGTAFDTVTFLEPGEPLTVLGRDLNGTWILVQTTAGQEGWVRITQLSGTIDIASVPLAENIPTPVATLTPEPTETPDGPTPEPTATVPEELAGRIVFELTAGGDDVCRDIQGATPAPFGVEDPSEDILEFDFENAPEISEQKAFRLTRFRVPDFIEVFVEGGVMQPAGCSDGVCTAVAMTLCASAFPDAPVGGFAYNDSVVIEVGVQSFDQLFTDFEAEIPTTFIVSE